MKNLLFAFLLTLVPLASAVADGEWDEQVPARQPTEEERNTVNSASDASFDKRLPPALPGERMNDSGHTVRVWSTAGPVPVSKAPEPWNDSGSGVDVQEHGDGTVSVIVDRRKLQDGHHDRHHGAKGAENHHHGDNLPQREGADSDALSR